MHHRSPDDVFLVMSRSYHIRKNGENDFLIRKHIRVHAIYVFRHVIKLAHLLAVIERANIIIMIRTAENLQRAMVFLTDALDIKKKERGVDRVYVGVALRNMGEVLRDQGQLEEARQRLEEAQAIFEECGSPHREVTAQALAEIGEQIHASQQAKFVSQ